MRRSLGLLFVTAILFWGCCKSKEDPVPQTVITLSVPVAHVYGQYLAGGKNDKPFLENSWPKSGTSFNAYIVQDGLVSSVSDVRSKETNLSNTDVKNPVTVDVPIPQDIDQKRSYRIILVDKSAKSVKTGNAIEYNAPLERGTSFIPVWYMAEAGAGFTSLPSAEFLTSSECLYIKNTTEKPIKVKHKGYYSSTKWYNTDAVVRLTVDSYVKAVVDGKSFGTESISGEKEIQPGETGFILSLFTPNGNKMTDASLVLEIDGKEVQTKPVSSDIEIENGVPYFLNVVWNGTTLGWGNEPEPETPAVINVSSESSGVNVISISDNGTMTIETTEDKVPKVGDILCSGPTELAPYGYLYKVIEVNTIKGQSQSRTRSNAWNNLVAEIKVIRTTLTSLIDNYHATFRFPINLNDVKVSNVITEEGVELTSSGDYQTVWQLPKKKLSFGNISFTPNVKIKPESLVFYLEIGDWQVKKFGADFDADFEASVQIDANFKGTAVDRTYPVYDVFLEPIVIMVGLVPVVVTPYFMVYLTIKVDGSAQLSWVPVSCEYDLHLGGYYNTEIDKFVPSEGREKFLTYENCKQTQDTWLDLNSGFDVAGTVKSGLGVGLSLGLYGCNLVGKGNLPIRINGDMINLDNLADLASLEVYADLYDKITAGISLNDIDLKPGEELHFNDICKTSIEFVCGASMHLGFNHPITGERIGYDPKFETNPLVLLKEKEGQTLFWPGFVKLNASMSGDNIHMSSNKLRPLIDIFEEKGFGFRYVKIIDGQIAGQWNMADVSSSYSHDVYKSLWEYTVETDIPVGNFEWGNTYFICPYTCFKWYDSSAQYYISRQGMYITISNNGKLIYNELGEVPGEDL